MFLPERKFGMNLVYPLYDLAAQYIKSIACVMFITLFTSFYLESVLKTGSLALGLKEPSEPLSPPNELDADELEPDDV